MLARPDRIVKNQDISNGWPVPIFDRRDGLAAFQSLPASIRKGGFLIRIISERVGVIQRVPGIQVKYFIISVSSKFNEGSMPCV